MRINRRDFMKHSAGAIAAAYGVGAAAPKAFAGTPKACSTQMLGNTGITTTFLGMGTGVRASNNQSALTRRGDNHYMAVLEHAYDQGLRYFDMADMYGAHSYVRDAMKSFMDRDKVLLQTKTFSRDGDQVAADLERYHQELDTDVIDLALFHCLMDEDWPNQMGHAMDVMEDAKAKGRIRAHGVSCHDFGALQAAVESDWVDTILVRINPYGNRMDAPTDEVLPVLERACENGKGLIGMKILGEGDLADRKEECFEFAANLDCIHAITIGFLDTQEIDEAVTLLGEA